VPIGLFLDVDQTLTKGFIQAHYARQLGCEDEYKVIEAQFQAETDPGASIDFGDRITSCLLGRNSLRRKLPSSSVGDTRVDTGVGPPS
jgi:hypothetical protein